MAKKGLPLLLLAGAGLAQQPGSVPPDPRVLMVPFEDRAIEVDGELREWSRAARLDIRSAEQIVTHPTAGKWGGEADLSATFYLSYDAAHLYLAGSIRDDSLVPVGEAWHQADAIEVFLDFDLADAAESPLFNEDDVQLFLMPLNRQRPWGLTDYRNRDAAKPRGSALTGIRLVHRARADGYDFEAAIPFHNFPALKTGVREIGFNIAIDDLDDGLERYQYMTWNGRNPVDDTRNMGRLRFQASAPLEDAVPHGGGFSQRLLASLPFVLVPPLVMLVLWLGLRAWGVASRRRPVLRPIGRVLGVGAFLAGLILPGWLIDSRDDGQRARADAAAQTLRAELAAMERGNMASYPGGQLDRPLMELLAGRSVDRVQSFTYRTLSYVSRGGFGSGPKHYPGEGFSVLPYWVPLPLEQTERINFAEPLIGAYLNVVLSTPVEVNSELPAQVRLSVTGVDGEAVDHLLELDGVVELGSFVNRPALGVTFEQIELSGPVESVSLTAQNGEGLKLVGLTLLPDLIQPPQPLHLGLPSRSGVETDLRGPYPEDFGIHLGPGQVHRVELDPERVEDFEKLWLFYRADYPFTGDVSVARDAPVCRIDLIVEGEEDPPEPVLLRHQTSMFFGVARFNTEASPPDPAAQIAFAWDDADRERYVTLSYEADLPEGRRVRALELRNLGDYPVRFRSAVFGAPKRNLLVEPEESPLEYPGTSRQLRMKPDRLAQLAALDFAVFRNGVLEAATLSGPAARELSLPNRVERELSSEEPVSRVTEDGDRRTYEAYVALPGVWSGGVLAAIVDDPDFGAHARGLHLVGFVLCLFAAPVLLLLFSEMLSVFNSLRLRLIVVFSVAMLVPLALLSLVLVRVLEEGHDNDARESMRQGMAAATERLRTEESRLVESAEAWLRTLASEIDAVPMAELTTAAQREELREQLRGTMSSQLPPGWDGGYLRLEFAPLPETKLEPINVFVGDPALAVADAPLRTSPGVHLAWGEAFFGVRREFAISGRGICSLSVARPHDQELLAGLSPGRGVVLTDSKGYPLEIVGGGDLATEPLARAARQPGTMAGRREALEGVLETGQPVVQLDPDGDGGWLGVYQVLRDQQDTPRVLLGVIERARPATLSLGFGRVPVRGFFLAGAGLLLLLSVFLSFVVTARISKPIERLEAGALALGSGDLHVAIETDEGGQIGRLTKTFNRMAQDLRGRIQDLHDLNGGIQDLTSRLDVEDVLATAVSFFARHSAADAVRILVQDRDRVHVAGEEDEVLDPRAPDVVALLEASGPMSLLWIGAARKGAALPGLFDGFRSALALPLVQAGRGRGSVLLLFESAQPRTVNLDLLTTMSSHTAAAMANARLYRHAVEDADTGAYVPDYMRRLVTEEVGRALEQGRSVAMIGLWLVDGDATTHAWGVRRTRRLMERWARALRADLPDGALLGRCEHGFHALVPNVEVGTVAALVTGLPGIPDEVTARIERAWATCPEQAASAEFLFDALELARRGDAALPARLGERGLVMHSPAMQELLGQVERVAPTDLTILLEGETGTGKEVLTDLIHRWSRRADGPLVKVHCAALSQTLLQSELFGHEKGAFTGAISRKIGKFEQAQGGTIFLDEIGEISLDVQVKLLRVLQQREIDRVGGLEPVPVDVRVIAATNRDMRELVATGAFREDLYYRLQGVMLLIPPLRERKQEIPGLVEEFHRQAREAGHTRVEGLTPEALDELYRREWPGNVRELRNTVSRAVVLARGRLVTRDDVLGLHRPEVPQATDPEEPGSILPAETEEPRPVESPARELPAVRGPRSAPVAQPELSERHVLAVSLLRDRESVSTQEYVAVAGVSPRTGLRDLGELVELGLVERIGKRRGARYRLAKDVAKSSGPPGN